MLFAIMRHLLLSLFALVLLIALPQRASACSCFPRVTVLDEFDRSDEVVIARAVSVEKAQTSESEASHHYPHGIRSTTLVVERVFKGTLKVRDEIVLGQGGGANCTWTLRAEAVGHQFLFYLNRPDSKSQEPHGEPVLWYASECGRSRGLAGAAEDLLYLENLSKLRGKTRISGTLNGGWVGPELDVEGKRIKIIGPKKNYEVKTDKNGVFEIYDVPAGKYFLDVEAPVGWKVAMSWLRYSASVVKSEIDYSLPETRSSKQFAVKLEPKKHASVDVMFEIDNYVRGRVIGPKGKPMSGVCVYLLLPEKDWGPSDCTDEQGRFEISSVPAGEWILGANQDDKASAREPFRAIFYPGVRERQRATVINISPGQVIENIDLVIPKLEETITVKGVLQYSDGQPVAEEWVEFKATKKNEKADGGARTQTDEAGRFTLTMLKGQTGEIAGQVYRYVGYYKNCPKVDELLVQNSPNRTLLTNVVKLTTEENIYDLQLTFPFPRCEKAKE